MKKYLFLMLLCSCTAHKTTPNLSASDLQSIKVEGSGNVHDIKDIDVRTALIMADSIHTIETDSLRNTIAFLKELEAHHIEQLKELQDEIQILKDRQSGNEK